VAAQSITVAAAFSSLSPAAAAARSCSLDTRCFCSNFLLAKTGDSPGVDAKVLEVRMLYDRCRDRWSILLYSLDCKDYGGWTPGNVVLLEALVLCVLVCHPVLTVILQLCFPEPQFQNSNSAGFDNKKSQQNFHPKTTPNTSCLDHHEGEPSVRATRLALRWFRCCRK